MTPSPRPPAPSSRSPAVRHYTRVSLLALLVVFLLLVDKGLGEYALIPVALGCITLLLQLSFGPPLVILTIVLLLVSHFGPNPFTTILPPDEPKLTGLTLADIALSAAILIYALGYYRVLSLVHAIFRVDARLKSFKLPDKGYLEKRSIEGVEPRELPILVGTGFAWAVAGWAFWQWLGSQQTQLGFESRVWRGLILFWIVGLGLLLTSALMGYLGRALGSRQANLIYLQDQVWQQTRREQSRINRWLVWARLRWQRRKEAS